MERRKRIYRKMILVALGLSITALLIISSLFLNSRIPEKMWVQTQKETVIKSFLPLSIRFENQSVETVSVNHKALPKGAISLNYGEDCTLSSKESGTALITYQLFGWLDVKKTEVSFVEEQNIIPMGKVVGIELKTDGILVLGTGEVITASGGMEEPAKNIVKTGDYILKADGENVTVIAELQRKIEEIDEDEIVLTIQRNQSVFDVKVPLLKDENQEKKAGIWVRDSTQGLGTLTYITEDGAFAALGHGISDVDTGVTMSLSEGAIYQAEVAGVTKGSAGTPGEISGVLHRNEEEKIGIMTQNTGCGIYGNIVKEKFDISNLKSYEVGYKQEIEIGKAYILADFSGTASGLTQGKLYEAKIEKLNYDEDKTTKGITIKITDSELLEKTNGIVQGMSGSPIVQNGRIVGAVTHVLVNDPTRGYGIFIENMLEH